MVSLVMCEPASVPYSLWESCGNHAQLGGGSATERLMSVLAYGWVEHCGDVSGYGTKFFQDKYSCLC